MSTSSSRRLPVPSTTEILITEMSDLTVAHFLKICRICLKQTPNVHKIQQTDHVIDYFSLYLSIEVRIDDDLPPNICSSCLANLQLCNIFNKQIEHAEKFLRSIVKKKNEISQTDEGEGNNTKAEKYKCNECDKFYKNIKSLRKHVIYKHSDKKKAHKCLHCDKSFYLKSVWARHVLTHTKERPFQCGICGKFYPSRSYLTRHQKIHLTTKTRPCTCEICGKNFTSKDNLKSHSATHCTNRRLVSCHLCTKTFTKNAHFQSHLKYIHTKDKSFLCHFCAYSFTTNSDLNHHISRRHTNNGKNEVTSKYHCDICSKLLSSATNLKLHVINQHQGMKPFECETCKKCFASKQSLKLHRRYHIGDRPYKCEFCPKTFVTNGAKIVHLRVHTGEKPYRCETCQAEFSQSSSLKSHKRTH